MDATDKPTVDAATGRHLVRLLSSRFFNRTDIIAAYMDWGKPHPIQADKQLESLLTAHVFGEQSPQATLRYTTRWGTSATKGRSRLGTYAPTVEGTTRWLCLDFDGHGHADPLADAEGAAIASLRRCQDFGIPGYLERSGGGNGWHLWVFFEELVRARDAIYLGRHLAPANQLLQTGGLADVAKGKGVELFPKQQAIRKQGGYGNMVWLPFYWQAKGSANQFHRLVGDHLEPYIPEVLDSVPSPRLTEIVDTLPKTNKGVSRSVPASESIRTFLSEVRTSAGTAPPSTDWKNWRDEVLAKVPLEDVYGEWLTGAYSGEHWLECRDPESPSGDQNPSAGVSDGMGSAPRGLFHSHRTGASLSLFDFMIRHGQASDFMDAARKVANLTGVPLPDGSRSGESGPSDSALPSIMLTNTQFRDVVSRAWEAVHKANQPPKLFRRLNHMVSLCRQELMGRTNVTIVNVEEMAMYDAIAKAANWFRETDKGVVAAPPPKDVARDMLEVVSEQLGRLDSVAFSPLFDTDGGLLAAPGYYPHAGMWIEIPTDFPVDDIPEVPTTEQIGEARRMLLDELLVDFPFVDQSDRAQAVGAIILPFVRRMVQGCTPIHLIEAPTEGSGKGYVCHAISILATGRESDPRVLSQDDNEARKLLTSELLGGRPIILLDNVDDRKQLASPTLAAVITSPEFTDRLLYTQQTITVPNRAVWLLTGNNPKVSMELARRCVRIRIDPRMDRPYLRGGFKHDPFIPWVKQNRMPLVRAVLLLVRAWIAAGKPDGKRRLGTFETWSSVIGGILEVAGIPGFLENLEALYETADLEGESWRQFVAVWWEVAGETPRKVADLNSLCEERELLLGVRGDGSPRSQQTRLGNALMNKRDRVFGGIRIVRVGQKGKENCVHYALVPNDTQSAVSPRIEARTSDLDENLNLQVLPQGSRPETRIPTGDSLTARTCENLEEVPLHMRAQAGAQARMHEGEENADRFSQVLARHATTRNDNENMTRTLDAQVLAEPPQVLTEGPEVLAALPASVTREPASVGDVDLADFGDEWDSLENPSAAADEDELDSTDSNSQSSGKRPVGLSRF